MTNLERIRTMDAEQLAPLLVQEVQEVIDAGDYDADDHFISFPEVISHYRSMSGSEYEIFENAVSSTIRWLNKNVEDTEVMPDE